MWHAKTKGQCPTDYGRPRPDNSGRMKLRWHWHLTNVAHPQYPKQRRFRRYNLEFPVSLTFSVGGQTQEIETVSKNVSTGGVLLKAGDQIPLHTAVSLIMNVQGQALRRPVRLVGEGEVVRVEELSAAKEFAIAIECRSAITQLEDQLDS